MLFLVAIVLLCLELGFRAPERCNCYSCVMNYPRTGCISGVGACQANLQRGQTCVKIHFFHQEQEHGYARPGFRNCGIEKMIGNYTVKFECCTETETCSIFNPDDDDGDDLDVSWT